MVPIIFVGFIILSVVLFIKRDKIIAKYDVGYISSFLFTAYMLMPVFAAFSFIVSPQTAMDLEVPGVIFLIYPIIGLIIFLLAHRGESLENKIGKFFAMIGIGLCAGYVFVFKMLRIMHLFESGNSCSENTIIETRPIPNTEGKNDMFRCRINEYGEIYDYGGVLLARINDNGDIFYPNGKYYAHMDYSGDVYDASGRYLGRIKDGEIKNSSWVYTGNINGD